LLAYARMMTPVLLPAQAATRRRPRSPCVCPRPSSAPRLINRSPPGMTWVRAALSAITGAKSSRARDRPSPCWSGGRPATRSRIATAGFPGASTSGANAPNPLPPTATNLSPLHDLKTKDPEGHPSAQVVDERFEPARVVGIGRGKGGRPRSVGRRPGIGSSPNGQKARTARRHPRSASGDTQSLPARQTHDPTNFDSCLMLQIPYPRLKPPGRTEGGGPSTTDERLPPHPVQGFDAPGQRRNPRGAQAAVFAPDHRSN
jgi:hypothetical protein